MNTQQDRDSALEQWLRRSPHDQLAGATTAACLDAETASAWLDGGLTATALADAQAHTANCPRCQALLQTLSDVEGAAAEWPVAERSRPARSWLGWMVPLAAAATVLLAVGVWNRAPGRPEATVRNEQTTPLAAPSAIDSVAPQPATSSPAGRQTAPPAAPSSPAQPADERRRSEAPAPPVSPTTLQNSATANAEKSAAAGAALPAPAPALKAQASAAATTGALEESVTVAGAPSSAPVAAAPAARALGRAAVSLVIASPDPAIRWRLSGALVEKTVDGGATWTLALTGDPVTLGAGFAPAGDVCWLVGAGGVVLLATDGTTWRRLSFPVPLELTGVTARDARAATVTAADGRRFVTTDGGRSWNTP